MESLIFVDSNIWCYYFDRSAHEHNAVSKKLEKILDDGVAINTVVAMDVAHYLIKNMGSDVGRTKMDLFLSYPMEIMNFDQYLASGATSWLAKSPLRYL
jgi:predicted nucleic acid-binding protein